MSSEAFFDGQRDGEEILFVWRRNLATLLRDGLIVVGLSLAVVYSFAVAGASLMSSLLLGLWLITVPITIGLAYYKWWNDLYVLTNQRLVDVDQKKLFHRAVAEAPLANIQDVSFEQRGIVQTLLNYGTVIVQTASVSTRIDMVGLTDPQAVQQAILRTVAAAKKPSQRASVADENPLAQSVRTQLG